MSSPQNDSETSELLPEVPVSEEARELLGELQCLEERTDALRKRLTEMLSQPTADPETSEPTLPFVITNVEGQVVLTSSLDRETMSLDGTAKYGRITLPDGRVLRFQVSEWGNVIIER